MTRDVGDHKMRYCIEQRRSAVRHMRSALGLMTVITLAGGCDQLIDVEAPSRVLADNLFVPANAQLLVNSVGTELSCALAHSIVSGGLIGSELLNATTLVVYAQVDRRNLSQLSEANRGTCDSEIAIYLPLAVTRWLADQTLTHLEQWTDAEVANRSLLVATTATYAAYSYTLIGELMCSAAFDLGPEQTPAQVFQLAEDRFTRAIAAAQAANNAAALNLARVGRARTRLRRGNVTAAADDAKVVPNGFVQTFPYSSVTARRQNIVWARNVQTLRFTVDPSYRGLTYQGVADPRVGVVNAGRVGSDGVTPMWNPTKYGVVDSPIPLAKWAEAQLIVAEAELSAGNLPAAVAIINTLHTRAGLPAFNSNVAADVRAQLLYERKAELFLESHHLGDLRQYNLPLSPAAGTPFPGGGSYLNERCVPLPETERSNNPNL